MMKLVHYAHRKYRLITFIEVKTERDTKSKLLAGGNNAPCKMHTWNVVK